jgi:hypothetical protein
MTRRMFTGGIVAGVCARREWLVLEAVAAERMPHRMVVSGVARSPFFELRDYGVMRPGMVEVLERYGIRAVWERDGRFLFPFETLAAREKAWRRVSADADWNALRTELREISVFRVRDSSRKGAELAKKSEES